MLISPAYAQSAGGSDFIVSLLPLVLIFVVFYFLLIRPQQKKVKAHKEMLSNIRRGDRVVTNGGIIGTVTRVNDDSELTLEIAEGVRVRSLRSMVADVLAKTEPARARDDDAEDEDEDAPAETPRKRSSRSRAKPAETKPAESKASEAGTDAP
ncbi:MAG: preprotein translocase subunit YajC [Oceanibaculum nanhaiense]|uniref:preprotein translocase subunit YajC n=1 Tax=Oceanibaculum nanhaiense TaxID=1909734 RepID=UPI0025A315C6|nr:preprotein translocase subunit YajC [Oceanibaculum nanhaiense]MDM7947815.1 preprotein translocase subunit YajC [Oceanibaculum nanhaiense]